MRHKSRSEQRGEENEKCAESVRKREREKESEGKREKDEKVQENDRDGGPPKYPRIRDACLVTSWTYQTRLTSELSNLELRNSIARMRLIASRGRLVTLGSKRSRYAYPRAIREISTGVSESVKIASTISNLVEWRHNGA